MKVVSHHDESMEVRSVVDGVCNEALRDHRPDRFALEKMCEIEARSCHKTSCPFVLGVFPMPVPRLWRHDQKSIVLACGIENPEASNWSDSIIAFIVLDN